MAEQLRLRPPVGFRSFGDRLSSRVGWSIFIVGLVIALSVGAFATKTPTSAQRIANLDAIIKCPPCSGLSIAQSNTSQAKALRVSVATWVGQGWSDQRIEDQVVTLYGPDELLRPSSPVIWIVPIIAVIAALIGLGFVLTKRSRRSTAVLAEGDRELVRRALESER